METQTGNAGMMRQILRSDHHVHVAFVKPLTPITTVELCVGESLKAHFVEQAAIQVRLIDVMPSTLFVRDELCIYEGLIPPVEQDPVLVASLCAERPMTCSRSMFRTGRGKHRNTISPTAPSDKPHRRTVRDGTTIVSPMSVAAGANIVPLLPAAHGSILPGRPTAKHRPPDASAELGWVDSEIGGLLRQSKNV